MGNTQGAVEVQVAHVSERLVCDYAGQVPDEVVRSLVTETFRSYGPARVTQFLPVLIDREVRQRLGHVVRASA